jgi:hypothetical protein
LPIGKTKPCSIGKNLFDEKDSIGYLQKESILDYGKLLSVCIQQWISGKKVLS